MATLAHAISTAALFQALKNIYRRQKRLCNGLYKVLTNHKRLVGKVGEHLALRHLEKKGYRLIAKNLFVGKLEADLLAMTASGLVLVEVRTRKVRSSHTPTDPFRSLGVKKLNALKRLANRLLSTHGPKYNAKSIRIDLVGVKYRSYFGLLIGKAEIEHIVSAEF